MAREMSEEARKKEQQWAKLVSQYGSEEAVLAAYKKKKELAERNIERKADYQTFSPKSIGESMPAKPATTAQKLALFQQANPSALLSPRDSIKNQMTTTGVPNEEERALQYKEFSDDAALLGGLDEGEGGDPRVVEQAIGRREDLGTEALPVVQAMERGQKTEEEAEKRRLELGMRKQNYMTEGDREKYGATQQEMTFENNPLNPKQEMRIPTAGGLGELPPSVRARLEEGDGGRRITPYRPDIMRDGKMDWRGKEKELGGESIPYELENFYTPEMQAEAEGGDEKLLRGRTEEFLANADEEEQEEVIAQVISATDPFSEATATVKEDTGRYVRYDGATKKGITLNKTRLQQLYDRKGKMALLQHVPQENRAALLYNWGLISPEDLSDTQKQSAKEVLELEKINLQIAELKNKTGKMSDAQKAQVTAASNALTAAVKERRWPEAEALQDQLNELIPGRKNLNIGKIQEDIDKKLLGRPELTRVKELMGTQVWDGYFTFKNDLVKKIDLLKRSTAGSGELAKFLGGTIDTGEHQGKTWSDVLEGQKIPSWKTVSGMNKNDPIAKALALKLSRRQNAQGEWVGGTDDIKKINRGAYMGHVLPILRQKIMKNQYGHWYTTIEKELHGAQGNATAEAQKTVNSNEIEKTPDPKVEPPPEELQSAIPERPKLGEGSFRQEQGGRLGDTGTVVEQPPEATKADMAQLAQQNEAKLKAEKAKKAAREEQRKEEFGEWKKTQKEEDSLEGQEKKDWLKFKEWGPRLLEKSKEDPEFLDDLRERYEEEVKKKKADGKSHYWEDYNLAYIKYLLNK